MRLTTINEKALIDTATLLVGEQAAATILAVYQLVDQSQREAYELGVLDASEGFDKATAFAFDQGYDHGYDQAEAEFEAEVEEARDNGYIAGVRDARARPAEADANVAEIMAYQAEQYYDGFDEAIARDSGDEQPNAGAGLY